MAALTTQNIVDAGTAPTFVAAAASDTAEIGSGVNTYVHYKNTDSNAKTITITVPGNTSYGEPNPDPALTLPANTGELRIPLRKIYDPGDGTGRATLAVTGTGGVTGVTVAVVRLG
ncbi:hypothetical protein ACFY7C_19650 [Streptomyces sp. NPDC012769]|uniref:hypothetical protein n=1 Tax=Streptomyces sp. NPDC012769 TaxID=3364848 RepID=UPI00368A1106